MEGMKLAMIESVCQSPVTVQPSDIRAPVQVEAGEKQKELLACLKFPESSLTCEQAGQLKNLLMEYSDLYRIGKSELGCSA